ncbi:MAG: PspA/IM30 family protein [bacterium]
MNLLKRISELITANINHLLDQAEEPEVMVKQIIRDMEESIIELRKETVRALAHQKQVEKQIQAATDLAKDLEEKAKLALNKNEEELARKIITKKLDNEERRVNLKPELQSAAETVEQLKSDLAKLEDQVQEARRKKEELIRRKRAAKAKLSTQKSISIATEALGTTAKSILNFNESQKNLESYEEAILKLESEAEAANELLNMDLQNERELEKHEKAKTVEKELERLKKAQKKP